MSRPDAESDMGSDAGGRRGGILDWFARSRVAANLLMIGILITGAFSVLTITVKQFPEIAVNAVTVTVALPGAAPSEVLDAIVVPIEDALLGLEGIRKITSSARSGVGTVTAESMRGTDLRELRDDIVAEIDQITVFPEASEAPTIVEADPDELAIQIALTGGPADDLKTLAEQVRRELSDLPEISRAEIVGIAEDQIDIEVPRETLRAYGLGLPELAERVGAQSLDLSGGEIDAGTANLTVRTLGERDTAAGFRDIVLLTSENGAMVRLGDIAQIREGVADTAVTARLDGDPVVLVSVYRVGAEQVLGVVDAAKTYLDEELRPRLTGGLEARVWRDEAEQLRGRINLLIENGAVGISLILVILLLFLDVRVAAWVAFGVVIAFVGAFAPMLFFGVTINQQSLFGFILALGIVVDDAIVVGENVYTRQAKSSDPVAATQHAVHAVHRPIIYSTLTTVAAFVPLLILPGSSGSFIAPIAAVTIFVLSVSLLESLLILPHHLSRLPDRDPRRFSPRRLTEPVRKTVDGWFQRAADGPVTSTVRFSVRHPAIVLVAAAAISVASFGLLSGGWVKFVFFPEIEGDYVTSEIALPELASEAEALIAADRIVAAAEAVASDRGGDILLGTLVRIGFAAGTSPDGGESGSTPNVATVEARLSGAEGRDISSAEFETAWREKVGEVAGAERLIFSASAVGVGAAVELQVSGPEEARNAAIQTIVDELGKRKGVFDIRDDRFSSAREIAIELRPEARNYGVTLEDLADAVRGAFFGALVAQVPRDEEEVDIRVRLPASERNSIADLEEYRIATDEGSIPIRTVASLTYRSAPVDIERLDGRTIKTVTADVDNTVTTGGAEVARILSEIVPDLQQDSPDLRISTGGEQEESGRFASSASRNFGLALFAIYAVLALALNSFGRPLIVLAIIPFGFVGALIGHAVMGINLTLLSMFGVIGLAGVIVNDSLLIVDAIVTAGEDDSPDDAITAAARGRFRAVILTTLTTAFGIAPIVFETSVQAQFLVPTAVALSFGVVLASILQMLVVPALASVYAGVRKRLRGNRHGAASKA